MNFPYFSQEFWLYFVSKASEHFKRKLVLRKLVVEDEDYVDRVSACSPIENNTVE